MVQGWFQVTRIWIRPETVQKLVTAIRAKLISPKDFLKAIIGKDYKKGVHNLNSAMSFRVLSVAFAPLEVIE
ncbi:MAG TPA: hypothetical protein DCE14_06425 [Kosmotogaceae bacterium]|nr:hypothetical protein [Kosmotogaceae bacterium]